jgi:hypothetical protein
MDSLRLTKTNYYALWTMFNRDLKMLGTVHKMSSVTNALLECRYQVPTAKKFLNVNSTPTRLAIINT